MELCSWEELQAYLEFVRKLDRSTIERYKCAYNVLSKFFKNQKVTLSSVITLLNEERNRGLSNSSLNNIIKLLKHVCAVLKSDILKGFSYFPKIKKKIRYLTPDEFELVLHADTPLGYRMDPKRHRHVMYKQRVILEFAYWFCARIQNIRNLRWDDLYNNTVIFRDTKNGDDYEFPVPPELWDKLMNLKRFNEYVFGSKTGPADPDKLNKMLRSRGQRANIHKWEELTMHSLRYSGANSLANSGVPQYDLQDYMMHKDANSTKGYIQRNRKRLEKVQQSHPLHTLTKQDFINDIRAIVDKYRQVPGLVTLAQAVEQFISGHFFTSS